jgi:hypothetical protein
MFRPMAAMTPLRKQRLDIASKIDVDLFEWWRRCCIVSEDQTIAEPADHPPTQ